MTRYLVTGGAGFIGANLCGRLLDEGHQVVCLDNFSSSTPANILHLVDRPGFTLLVGDVRSTIRVDADEIFHLACPASPPRYQVDPVFTMETSVLGAINVLEMARRTGAKVLLASTSEIYGEPAVSPQPETYRGNVNSWGPRACYDEGKRCAESLFYDYIRKYGVAGRVVRIFNTYGPHMAPDDGRVVSNFIVQALSGEPLTIYGDGSQTRSLCYVDDLVEGFLRVMAAPVLPGPVNLGNPHERTILEIASAVVDIVGRGRSIEFHPLPMDDPSRRCPDISLARAHLRWEPAVDLGEGLRRTVAYFAGRVAPAFGPAVILADAAE
ncbi:UDP-glucuronic acid decarboxylase family protein [Aurantimonas sp. Leaf443]|uniref:UDP-glucuronic acid decarboxylase family protein n=1 Tax=Aurantimonas sp. Leaf443 TaxID=1736378 RepID=UPI0006FEDE8C|nr:UDP-glucuronic acid decarboxylase family protein [Aurantimonas sp. Leaf443]KQT88362.1 NAD-dependent dehydratase [Aurantimonas sp. Leaf443]